MTEQTLSSRTVAEELPSDTLHRDERVTAFRDEMPPLHTRPVGGADGGPMIGAPAR